LIGVIRREQGQVVTRYFTARSRDLDRSSNERRVQTARRLAGVWNDLEWETMEIELDRIRHQGTPTPPIDDL
jgi:hypothetical protein